MRKETNIMKDQELLQRITVSPKVMVGKPVIKGTRLIVEYVLNLLALQVQNSYDIKATLRCC